MTTREQGNRPSQAELDLDAILADGDPIVILLDEDTIPAAPPAKKPAAARVAAPENAPQLINLRPGAKARVAGASVATPPLAEARGAPAPAADPAPADALSLEGPPEDFSDLISEVEETSRQHQQRVGAETPREQRRPGRRGGRRRRPGERREEWALGEIEEELDEEIQNELFPWAARMGLPWLVGAAALLAIALLGILVVVGRGYYELPIARRVFHHLHHALRPSGTVGLTMGIAGLGLMLFSLLYLVRKQFVFWARFGSLQGWLGVHIFTGFLGPALILFHAAFVPYSAIGVLAFASMLVVVFSGIVGRYVYVHCPKTLEGRELEFEDIRQRLAVYRKKLTALGIDASLLRIDEPATNKGRRMPWLVEAIAGVIWGDRESKHEFARLSSVISKRDDLRVQMSRILILARRLAKERQWVVRYNELRKIMGAWRFFHRWLAIIMLLAVLYHVGITVVFGDLWIFGGKN